MVRTFSVEPAKSGRSTCKCCNEKIGKSVLRMGTHQQSSDDYPAQTKWFHLACFTKKIRKGPKTKDDIVDFDKLTPKQQKKVMKHVFGETDSDDSSSDSSSDDDDVPIIKKTKMQKRGKKRKKLSSSDESSEDEPPKKKIKLNVSSIDKLNVTELKSKCKSFGLKQSGKKEDIKERLRDFIKEQKKQKKKNKKPDRKLVEKEKKRYKEITDDLNGFKVKDLKQMLEKNNVKKIGNKSDLIQRIADCKIYGVYPRCPECGGAKLQIKYTQKYGHNGQGQWFCKGFMDDDHFRHCHFKSNKTFQRKKWID